MHSLRTTNREAARERFKEKQLLLGKMDADDALRSMTLETLCNLYRQTWKGDLETSTVQDKERILKRIKNDWPTGRLMPIEKIREGDCRLWLARYRFGPTSRNGYLWTLKDMLAFAVGQGWLSKNPAAGLKPEKQKSPKRPTPTFEEFQQIVTSVRTQKFNGHEADESADFLEAQGLLGLGQAEISDLTVRDVDFKREQVSVRRRKTDNRFIVPLFPQARPLLERRCAGKRHNRHLFAVQDAKRAMADACKRLDLPHYSQRSLRRMFITRAIERGVDVKVIAEWQGHRDGGKLILDTYSHVRPLHSQRMAALMTMDEEPENVVQMPQKKVS
jgi:integrase